MMTTDERREAGRLLASFRTRKARTCPICGAPFETWGKGVYCSVSCKLKAFRERRARREVEDVDT